MDMPANYQNFQHYINEGWSKQPKEIFKFLGSHIAKEPRKNLSVLDVGCATGELIYFLSNNHPGFTFTGIDVFDDLITQCSQLQPDKKFYNSSILDLPHFLDQQFDIITVVGVLSIFDDTELCTVFNNLFRACRSNGTIYILSPFNEYGVDCEIKHRKRLQNTKGNWEKGWNIFSKETIIEHIKGQCKDWSFQPFKINFDLEPKEDPVRTWTMRTESNERQLTNGLKLLIDHYLLKISV